MELNSYLCSMTKEEKHREYCKRYRDNNKEQLVLAQKNRLKKLRATESYKVYLLEDYNYVGTSQLLSRRFAQHRYENNRDCTNHRILYTTQDRSDALELEELLHDMGYEGRSRTYK